MNPVFFSNRAECLLENLKENLFREPRPFSKRMVVIPSPLMKSWISWEMTNDPELGISMGLEFCYINEAVRKLLKIYGADGVGSVLGQRESVLALDSEIRNILNGAPPLSREEAALWRPVFDYMEEAGEGAAKDRRLYSLCRHVGRLFQIYGSFGERPASLWEREPPKCWQHDLWNRMFRGGKRWSPLYRLLHSEMHSAKKMDLAVHVFAVSFLPKSQFRFFSEIGRFCPVSFYIHSPCQAFWSDLGAGRREEEASVRSHPLLVNSGRLGRETAKMIEEAPASPISKYIIPKSLLLHPEYRELISHDVFIEDRGPQPTLLQALQADMVLLRGASSRTEISWQEDDASVQVRVASSKMREVEGLYHAILQIIDKHSGDGQPIFPGDIIVMAPDISEYEGFIKSVFLRSESRLDVQIFDSISEMENSLAQGFLFLLDLAKGRWKSDEIVRFFEFPEVKNKFGITEEDLEILRDWVKEANILWGFDAEHRSKCLKGCRAEEQGTWRFGLHRAFLGAASDVEGDLKLSEEFFRITGGDPLPKAQPAQIEIYGKWGFLLESLYRDLSPLTSGISLSLQDWSGYFGQLLQNYFQFDNGDGERLSRGGSLLQRIESLAQCSETLAGNCYGFETVRAHLEDVLRQGAVVYRENHAQTVRFCSMLPMRAIPARVVCLIGMGEDAFPKKHCRDPMNLLEREDGADYFPSETDYDRYLFLEGLLSARDSFYLSYVEDYDAGRQKCSAPSLLISELLECIDEYYALEDEKISKRIVKRFPFHSFDPKGFRKESDTPNYFLRDFRLAGCLLEKTTAQHRHTPSSWSFVERCLPKEKFEETIEIKDLLRFAKKPVQHFFHRSLGIYLDKQHDADEAEEFQLSRLDGYSIRKESRCNPFSQVFDYYQRTGKAPSGLFARNEQGKLESAIRTLKENLEKKGILSEEWMAVDFDPDASSPEQMGPYQWKIPAISIESETAVVRIVGKLDRIASDGIWVSGKAQPESFFSCWPQILLANYLDGICEPGVIFEKDGKRLPVFMENAEDWLLSYLKLYGLCSQFLPFLLPQWTEPFLKLRTADECRQAVAKYLNGKYCFQYDPYSASVYTPAFLETVEDGYFEKWMDRARNTYGSLAWELMGKA